MSIQLWVLSAAVLLLAFVALLVVGWLSYRRASPELRALMRRLGGLRWRAKISLAGAIAKDTRVPALVRAVPVLLVLYLAMPIDLIPDFLPGIGQLDDVLAVAIGVGILLRFVPRAVLQDHLARLEAQAVDA